MSKNNKKSSKYGYYDDDDEIQTAEEIARGMLYKLANDKRIINFCTFHESMKSIEMILPPYTDIELGKIFSMPKFDINIICKNLDKYKYTITKLYCATKFYVNKKSKR
jgi:hypothetical protein